MKSQDELWLGSRSLWSVKLIQGWNISGLWVLLLDPGSSYQQMMKISTALGTVSNAGSLRTGLGLSSTNGHTWWKVWQYQSIQASEIGSKHRKNWPSEECARVWGLSALEFGPCGVTQAWRLGEPTLGLTRSTIPKNGLPIDQAVWSIEFFDYFKWGFWQ